MKERKDEHDNKEIIFTLWPPECLYLESHWSQTDAENLNWDSGKH